MLGPVIAGAPYNCGSFDTMVCIEIPYSFLANDGPVLLPIVCVIGLIKLKVHTQFKIEKYN